MNKEIFKIIDDFFVDLENPGSYEIEDQAYISFFERYIEFGIKRDGALKNYLTTNETKHRTFIPFKDGFLSLLKETFWYYDEMIVVDPIIYSFVKFHQKGKIDEKELEQSKYFLKNTLRQIAELRDLIDEDYILFDSSRFLDDNIKSELAENFSIANSFSKKRDFRKILDKELIIIKGMTDIGAGKQKAFEIHYKNKPHHFVNASSIGKFNLKLHRHPDLLSSIFKHPQLATIKEINKKFPHAIKEVREKYYPLEIKLVIDSISQSSKLKCPVLFNNNLEEQVFESFSKKSVFKGLQENNHRFIKIIAPYLVDVDSRDLLELRQRMPDSFLNFRIKINQMITDEIMQRPDISIQILQENIYEKLSLELKYFKQDIKQVGNSVLTSVLPIIVGVATLQFGTLPIILNKIAGGLTGAGSLNAFNKLHGFFDMKNENKKNPLYYLWKVKT